MTETAAERAAAEARLRPQARKALLALIVGCIAAILDSTMVTLALHTLVVSLHSADGMIQWVTTGYLLAMAVTIPVTGWAESRWGGKRVWMAALVIPRRRQRLSGRVLVGDRHHGRGHQCTWQGGSPATRSRYGGSR